MHNHELGLFSYYITYCLSFPCSFMEVFKTKENTAALLEVQYLKNDVKFPLIASVLEKVTCETIMMNMMNVFFPLLIQTDEYIHN